MAPPTLTLNLRLHGVGLVSGWLWLLSRMAPLLRPPLTLWLANRVLHWCLWSEIRGPKGYHRWERMGRQITLTVLEQMG